MQYLVQFPILAPVRIDKGKQKSGLCIGRMEKSCDLIPILYDKRILADMPIISSMNSRHLEGSWTEGENLVKNSPIPDCSIFIRILSELSFAKDYCCSFNVKHNIMRLLHPCGISVWWVVTIQFAGNQDGGGCFFSINTKWGWDCLHFYKREVVTPPKKSENQIGMEDWAWWAMKLWYERDERST